MGYQQAGYRELLAVEWDDNAVETFKANFPGIPVYHGDISKLDLEECLELSGVKPGELDVLDGSPPCQGFSIAGKRKWSDPRNSLFKEFARLLKGLQPKAFVVENVPGMIKGYMKQAYLLILKELRACGYNVKGQVMNAMWYGVPQFRERIILIGLRNDLKMIPDHPKPKEKPITVREALQGVKGSLPPPLSPFLKNIVPKMRQGQSADDVSGRGGYQTIRVYPERPCPTITQIIGGIGFGMLIHPTEDRVFSIAELKRIQSFPDEFSFAEPVSSHKKLPSASTEVTRYVHAKAGIGNSVPPKLMEAVAIHIRDNFLNGANDKRNH